jgi:hypothetical protein
MNDKDKEAFDKWRNEQLNRPDIYDAWQAACDYKDMQIINGTKMKQMNDRIEDLLDENKKLREALEQIAKSEYEANPWTIVPTKDAKIAREALKE